MKPRPRLQKQTHSTGGDRFHLLLYYITDRSQFPGDEAARRRMLLEKIAEAARAGVDFIQLREKDVTGGQLEALARECVAAVQGNQMKSDGRATTRLLINSRSDVAIACGAQGVQLRSDDVLPSEARLAWAKHAQPPVIGVSCHNVADVARAAMEKASFAVLAPVFGKRTTPEARPTGLEELGRACREKIPVIALGGVTEANAKLCAAAGAAGVAGIRLFQNNDIGEIVRQLRG